MNFLKFFLILLISLTMQNFSVKAFQAEEESNERLLGRVVLGIVYICDAFKNKPLALEKDFNRLFSPIAHLYEFSRDQEIEIGRYYHSEKRSFKVMPMIERIIDSCYQAGYQHRVLSCDYARLLLHNIGVPKRIQEKAHKIAYEILESYN